MTGEISAARPLLVSPVPLATRTCAAEVNQAVTSNLNSIDLFADR